MKNMIEKVADMRRLQKLYFKRRDPLTLQAAKKAEREVDALLLQHEKEVKEQPRLF